MHTFVERAAQRRIDHPVALHAGLAGKCLSHNGQPEMRMLAAACFAVPCMAPVRGRFVDQFPHQRHEGTVKGFFHRVLHILPLARHHNSSHTVTMYNYKEEIAPVTRNCDHAGCTGKGEHRAPKVRGETTEYFWFCLDHVRDYNRNWDYFSGMSQEEIEDFQKNAPFGDRPTWNHQMRTALNEHVLHAHLRQFLCGDGASPAQAAPPLPEKWRRALEALELGHPSSRQTIKAQYKTLVKRYHPDVNQGDKSAEERFKRITASYQLLIEEYAA